jgi:hypothetical protein
MQAVNFQATPLVGSLDVYVSNKTYVDPSGSTRFVFPRAYCAYVKPDSTCGIWNVSDSRGHVVNE